MNHSASYIFPAVKKTLNKHPGRKDAVNVLLSEPFEFPTKCTDIAFTAKQTFKVCINFGIFHFTLLTACCLFNSGAGVNLCGFSMIPPSWTSPIKRQNVVQLQTATKKPYLLDGLILLHHHLGELSICIWFGIASNLAVQILLGSLLVDRFIHGSFLPERKVALRHS